MKEYHAIVANPVVNGTRWAAELSLNEEKTLVRGTFLRRPESDAQAVAWALCNGVSHAYQRGATRVAVVAPPADLAAFQLVADAVRKKNWPDMTTLDAKDPESA